MHNACRLSLTEMPILLIISAISGNDGESGTRLLTESAGTAASRAEGVFTAPVLISCSAKNAAVSRVKGFEVGARF